MSTPSIAIVNGSECYVPVTFADSLGNAYTPTSITYQVWDLTNGIEVVPPTTVTAASSVTITLDATVNTMNTKSSGIEDRQVTVKAGIPGGSYRNLVTTYSIIRRAGTP